MGLKLLLALLAGLSATGVAEVLNVRLGLVGVEIAVS